MKLLERKSTMKIEMISNHRMLWTIILMISISLPLSAQNQDSVYFATGFKIGQVTDSSAVILTRLSKAPLPVAVYHQQGNTNFGAPIGFDENMPVNQMDGAVEGSFGQVKVTLQSKEQVIDSDWQYVSAYQDYTFKYVFKGLSSNTDYVVLIEGRKNQDSPITKVEGSFSTPPKAYETVPITFTASTCQYFWSFDDSVRGFKMYDGMSKLKPDFHFQTGDYVYYDKLGPMANTIERARHKWHAMNSRPSLLEFFKTTPLYIQKDDHDLIRDDGTPFSPPFGEITYEDGLKLWQEQVPIQGKPYGTYRWGKDLQVWVIEGREFRNFPNRAPDSKDKTMWGNEQIAWFKQTIEESDATFKILISPTPIVGPDRDKGKFDNQSNASYASEGKWLREYLVDNEVIVVNGDRHWQYVSVDDETGLWEFSSGAVSNYLAAGWDEKDIRPEHRFLRVKGGFLAAKVYRKKGKPIMEFIHYDVEGNIVNRQLIKVDKKGKIY